MSPHQPEDTHEAGAIATAYADDEPGFDTALIADHYEISGDPLGQGSFAVTYPGRDVRTGEAVVIKRLDFERLKEWKVLELAEREAHVLAQLDHPNIPRYRAFVPPTAEHPGALVQTRAPGQALDTRIAQGLRLDDQALTRVTQTLLHTLAYLSDLRPPVVHRDIKPANIILSDEDTPYLIDFGAVRGNQSHGSTVAGTFGYMAPEQLHGEATPASDLYALGMTLLHLTTGIAPEALPRERGQVRFRQHVTLPEALAVLIEALTAPFPEDRPANATTALSMLDDALREHPIPGLDKRMDVDEGSNDSVRVTSSQDKDSNEVMSDAKRAAPGGVLEYLPNVVSLTASVMASATYYWLGIWSFIIQGLLAPVLVLWMFFHNDREKPKHTRTIHQVSMLLVTLLVLTSPLLFTSGSSTFGAYILLGLGLAVTLGISSELI